MKSAVQRARQRKQREGTRREILAAADRLLRERPFRELSVEIVMTETGLTRTAFYRHFDDVTELVLRLLDELGGELYPVAERWGARAGSEYPAAALDGLHEIVDIFARNGPLIRAIAEAAVTDERIERAYRGALEGLIALTAATLERLVELGRFEVLDTRALARALNLMNEAYLLDEFGHGSGDREIALETLTTVWLGALGPSGRRPAARAPASGRGGPPQRRAR